jgi:hypothetical protein
MYLRGKIGRVRKLIGVYKNPEELAYYKDAGEQPLYDIVFEWKEVWGVESPDEIAADIYEHWLKPGGA